MKPIVKKLSEENISEISTIHAKELGGFLSELGEDFLSNFYRASLSLPDIFTYIAVADGKTVGFITGIENTKNLYFRIIKVLPVQFILFFLKQLFTRRDFLLKIYKALNYPGFTNDIPELLIIVISKNYQRKGMGRMLFHKLVKEFKRRNITEFKIGVYADLTANRFYKKMDCMLIKSFPFLQGMMNYYLYKHKQTI